MPKLSSKRKFINTISKCYFDHLLMKFIELDTTKDEEDDTIENLLQQFIASSAFRYCEPFQPGFIQKTRSFCCDVLPSLDEFRFKQIVRLNWMQFQKVLEEIKGDPIFNGPHSSKQIPIEIQLIVTLYRLGSCGEGASLSKMASFFGLGDGGSIGVITKRVFHAILKLKKNICIGRLNESVTL